jgi:hypothetical protein
MSSSLEIGSSAMDQRPIIFALVALAALLAELGAWNHDQAVLTMAAAVITGLFSHLQVPKL